MRQAVFPATGDEFGELDLPCEDRPGDSSEAPKTLESDPLNNEFIEGPEIFSSDSEMDQDGVDPLYAKLTAEFLAKNESRESTRGRPSDHGLQSPQFLQMDSLTGKVPLDAGRRDAADRMPQAPPRSIEERSACAAQHGSNLQHVSGAAYLQAMTAGFLGGLDAEAFRVYRNNLLREVGGPTDPIVVMLIEQMTMAHHAIARLIVKMSASEHSVAVGIYGTTMAKLMAEFRRYTLALHEIRKQSASPTTVEDERKEGCDQRKTSSGPSSKSTNQKRRRKAS